MALTDAQMTDVRRYCGYAAYGTTQALSANTDTVYLVFGMRQMSLYERLTTLTATEETVVTAYLTKIATLELAVTGASDNLDTAQAAVWVHNKNEVQDRMGLYNTWRREFCAFIGCAPGPGLGDGTISILLG